MSLPGKLCVGILEEDNPQKSYFRFKPLIVESDGHYIPYAEESYPEEGCIRIVPDKNESYHFKSRMRRMGLFCVVDLRAHPDSNDKIRPNKNYREGSSEQNAFIIYSDVVREPAPETIFEVLPEAEPDTPRTHPRTAAVLLRGEALNPERYEWIADTDDHARLLPTGKRFAPEAVQVFDLPGFRGEGLSFAITAPTAAIAQKANAAVAPTPSESAPFAATPEAALAKPESAEAPKAAAPEDDLMPALKASPATPAVAPAESPKAAAPEDDPTPIAEASPAVPAKPAAAPEALKGPTRADKRARSRDGDPDKPWIHRDASMLPRPVDPRLPPSQRSLAAQSGMNPRRGRSLQELIDEKWQQSRLNQLGQPTSPIRTGAPLSSPVEGAVSAVRDVWSQPQLRRDLLESLSGIKEFGASLQECREVARKLDIERHLDGLEARRLALLGELDHLTQKNAETRKTLKEELRREAAGDLAEAVNRAKAAQADQARSEKLAAEARAAALDARKAVDALTGEELERRLRDFALDAHMQERLRLIKGEADAIPSPAPELVPADLNALAQRVEARFAAAGRPIAHADALNLCACVVVGDALILSGPVGCGKTETARLLAEAFGWNDRITAFAPGKASLEDDARVAALDQYPDTPAMLLLDDANLYPAADPLRGLDALRRPFWRLCLTLQDGSYPLPARALDRGFTVRLNPPVSAPWQPRARHAFEPLPPVSPRLAIPDAPLPAAVEERMQALREGLTQCGAVLSRRALDEAWRYCALMLDALGADAKAMPVFDRAVAQRLLPPLLASAPIEALRSLPALLEGLPLSRALLRQPLPIQL